MAAIKITGSIASARAFVTFRSLLPSLVPPAVVRRTLPQPTVVCPPLITQRIQSYPRPFLRTRHGVVTGTQLTR
jgi:hypothetical protein